MAVCDPKIEHRYEKVVGLQAQTVQEDQVSKPLDNWSAAPFLLRARAGDVRRD
jgi:hypothetical protein